MATSARVTGPVHGGKGVPFSREKVLSIYKDKATFLDRLEKAAEAAVANGTILPRVLKGLSQEALKTWDGIVGPL